MTSKEKALLAAEAASEKKGRDIRVLDLREMGAFTFEAREKQGGVLAQRWSRTEFNPPRVG